MKKTVLFLCAFAALASCNKGEITSVQEGRTITVEAVISESNPVADTRTSYEYADGKYKVTWKEGDQIWIQDAAGTREQFTLSDISADKKKAVFTKSGSALVDGPIWANLRSDASGNAYVWQQNIGWGMASYDCMSATGTLSGGAVSSLDFVHDIAILRITGLHFGSMNETIIGVVLASPNIHSGITYNKGVLNTFAARDVITCVNVNAAIVGGIQQKDLYIAFFPQNTGTSEKYTVTFTINEKAYPYSWTASGKYLPGKMYTLSGKTVEDPFGGVDPNAAIEFEDSAVKTICVAKWDTSGDGELSYAEAAAVTDINNVFVSNTAITKFNEFQYFTSVTTVGWNGFRGCSNLVEIKLPSSLLSIGSGGFQQAGITSIIIPDGVSAIASQAFNYCPALADVTVPASVVSLGHWAFRNLPGGCDFKILATTPPVLEDGEVFAGTSFDIKVPAASVDTYKAADNWSAISTRIKALP